METVTALHAIDLPPAAAGVPDWVHLTPAGSFRGVDGRGPYSVDPSHVIANSACPMVLDENHATDLAQTTGAASPARGWIVELAARADGVWGRVDWTEAGRALVADRAYRGISPAIASEKSGGRVLRVLRASLTNLPNFTMTTLHKRQDDGMPELTNLMAALGLKADASIADAVAAATRQRDAVSAHAAQIGRLAKAAGAPEAADAGAIETVLASAKGATAEVTRLAAEVVSLNTKLGAVETERAREKAERTIDAALKAGKPITALRDHYITRHMADAAAVETELNAMPSLHAGGIPRQAQTGAAADGFTEEEREVAQRMGLKPEQLKAVRDKRLNGGRA